jgi:hypothetical protein
LAALIGRLVFFQASGNLHFNAGLLEQKDPPSSSPVAREIRQALICRCVLVAAELGVGVGTVQRIKAELDAA